MDADCYLVLDQGGHSSRALVFDSIGQLLTQSVIAVASDQPEMNWVEQSPAELVVSLRQAANQAIRKLAKDQQNRIVAAALVTQRSSLVCWHKGSGEALYPVISWQDRRGAEWLSQQHIDPNWIHQRTGLTLNTHYGASKIRWCLDHLASVKQADYENQLVCGPLASWLIRQLTEAGQAVVDPANASRTLLWNINTLDWDDELLALFGITRTVLPELTATQSDFGLLMLDEIRLPLSLVNGDQSAAIFATGPLASDTAYVNAGTGAFVSVPWERTKAAPEFLLKSLVHQSDKPYFVVEGTVNGAASALDWAQQHCGLPDIEQLDQWAASGQSLPLFINGVAGLGSPYWRELRSEFIGEGTGEQKVVAVLESVLFLLQTNLQLMCEHGFSGRRIQVSGGLSRLNSFCQKLADLTAFEVCRPEQVEASARGAAYWLAGCPSNWQAVKTEVFHPSIEQSEKIKQRFLAWRQELVILLRNAD